jgi:hypothetical protein
MNERIKQLADQCMVEVKNVPCTGIDGWTSLGTVRQIDPVKFAELIVRECAQMADFADHTSPGDYVLKHFGVEL